MIVSETIRAFTEAYRENDELRQAAFDVAVEGLSQSEETNMKDPVGDFFRASFKELTHPLEKKKGRKQHVVVDRVNAVFETQEKEFLNQFTIT